MEEKIDPQNRIGQRNQNTSGLWMEVIEYKTATDVTVRFDTDGQVVENVTWRNFKTGSVANRAVPLRKNKEMRLGETRVMNNGLRATITEYRDAKNITVKFEDGTIVDKRTYYKFSIGEIGHPTVMFQNTMSLPEFSIGYYLKNLGFKKIKSGEWKDRGFGDYELDFYYEEKGFAIEYDGAIHKRASSKKNEQIKNSLCNQLGIKLYRIRDPNLQTEPRGSINYILKKSDFIHHRLLDCKQALEDILTNNGIYFDKDMIDFRRDYDMILKMYAETCVLAHAKSRIGEVVFSTTANQNMSIIAYRNSHDVDVKFESDGAIRKGIYYTQFLAGTVSHPNQLDMNYRDMRIGETKTMRNGLEAKICEYRTNKDIDVMFVADGRVVKHINYNVFKHGRVGHPDYDSNFLINRNKKIGMIGQTATGEHIKIVEYRSCTDIDILFVESNKREEHISFARFKKMISSNNTNT